MSEIGYHYWLNCRPERLTFSNIGQGSISLTPAVQQGGSRLVVRASVVRYRRAGAIPQGQGQVPIAPVVQTSMDIGRVLIEHERCEWSTGLKDKRSERYRARAVWEFLWPRSTRAEGRPLPSPPRTPWRRCPWNIGRGTTIIPFKMNETKWTSVLNI